MGDTISGGLTQSIRQKLGYDDAVNTNSPAYKTGEVVGEVVNAGLQTVTPCQAIGWVRNGIRAINAIQGAASTIKAGEAFATGDVLDGLENLAYAAGSFSTMLKSCFVAGTPLLTPDGSKAIEQFQAGDLILTRDENDPAAPVVARRVLQTFVRVSPVLNLHVRGRIIGTTAEHPFWVVGKGWLPAAELRIGDVLVSHDGWEHPIGGIADSGQVLTVYNLEVEEGHTYFVGREEWGWSIWAHNAKKYGGSGNNKSGFKGERGPGGARKHTPGHRPKHISQQAKKKGMAKKAKRQAAKEADQAKIQKAWDEMTSELQKLYKGVKGVDPNI